MTETTSDRGLGATAKGALRGRVLSYAIFVVLIAATIPWRVKAYYDGGLDSVVVAKAVLSLLALGAATALAMTAPVRRPVRASPLLFLLAYLACTVVGGWSGGELVSSMTIAVRIAILAVAILILSSATDPQALLGSLVAAMASYAVVGAATGVLSPSDDGRLWGAFPPLHPNELASMCVLVVLWCLWRLLTARDTWAHLAVIVLAVPVLLATGSRTPLGMLVVGALILLASATALRRRTIVIAALGAPVAVAVIAVTGLIQQVLLRGGSGADVTTLSNRTVAWRAALTPKESSWTELVGGGLVTKRIEVPGQLWNEQILDSSWISALVQGGLIGLGLCVLWLLHSLVSTADSPRDLRSLQLAILVYLGLRGLLESGLFDASPSFLVFFTVAVTTPILAGSSAGPAPGNSVDAAHRGSMRSERSVGLRPTPTAGRPPSSG